MTEVSEAAKVVGRNVRIWRRKRRLTQEKLGFLAGLHRTYVGRVERAECSMTIETLWRIAAALEVKPHLLIVDE
ncbi:MAG: helix-turn-helix transcriptional regulator [Rhizorhabdus sp.]|uniref:helix-turn-helix domain-containing protein n=1 Tax=Rhizorhabdus sp. TaxID=1968843 RepID=UPI001B78D5FF|nr:helix-turn-helix transcriptional regulator [Rhizorhabdus sp.]MBP8234301.1 helix-turn-helix transcriptional regulator [Rhizorhabdus sp.]